MRFALVLLAISVAAAVGYVLWGQPHRPGSPAWRAVQNDLAVRYSDVPTVSTADLAARLNGEQAPLLLDARTPDEYATSHLPGAVRVDPEATSADLENAISDTDRQREVVVYCSVGVRSARVAQRLREVGFARVSNLEGSIFQWANEGRPLVRGGQPVETVHPYDAVWGRLLDPSRRADR